MRHSYLDRSRPLQETPDAPSRASAPILRYLRCLGGCAAAHGIYRYLCAAARRWSALRARFLFFFGFCGNTKKAPFYIVMPYSEWRLIKSTLRAWRMESTHIPRPCAVTMCRRPDPRSIGRRLWYALGGSWEIPFEGYGFIPTSCNSSLTSVRCDVRCCPTHSAALSLLHSALLRSLRAVPCLPLPWPP
jgi:hypothetical protein